MFLLGRRTTPVMKELNPPRLLLLLSVVIFASLLVYRCVSPAQGNSQSFLPVSKMPIFHWFSRGFSPFSLLFLFGLVYDDQNRLGQLMFICIDGLSFFLFLPVCGQSRFGWVVKKSINGGQNSHTDRSKRSLGKAWLRHWTLPGELPSWLGNPKVLETLGDCRGRWPVHTILPGHTSPLPAPSKRRDAINASRSLQVSKEDY